MKRILMATAAMTLALVLSLSVSLTALAHEPRTVGGLELVVGWMVEPTFVGERNGISLTISKPVTATTATTTTEHADEHADEPEAEHEHDEAAANAVVGAENTLTAEVLFGGETKTVPLRAVYGQPGAYTADIVPTKAGDYRFHFTGTVDGQPIDETFDSADGKFDGAAANTDIQFPAPVAAAAAVSATAATAVSAAEQSADTVRLLTFLSLGIGAAALLVALAALSRVRG